MKFNFRDLIFYDIENFSIGNYVVCKDGKLSFDFKKATVSCSNEVIKIDIDDREITITMFENKPFALEYRLGSINVIYSNNAIDIVDINLK